MNSNLFAPTAVGGDQKFLKHNNFAAGGVKNAKLNCLDSHIKVSPMMDPSFYNAFHNSDHDDTITSSKYFELIKGLSPYDDTAATTTTTHIQYSSGLSAAAV